MDRQVGPVVAAAFPDREVAAVESTGPSWNDANRTVRVEFEASHPVYLKLAADGDDSRVVRERAVLDFVAANCEVPAPAVVASGTASSARHGPGDAVPYLATRPLAGRPLLDSWTDGDREHRVALARQVGVALASVHETRFASHGRIAGGGRSGLRLETASWTDVLVDTIEAVRPIAPDDRFDHHFDEVVAAVEANRDLLDDAPAALLHGDPAMPNCVVDGDSIGLLDWELAHVGDPARDVYRARDQQFDGLREPGPEAITAAYLDGYRERAGGLPAGYEERRPVYEAVRFLGVSGYVERTAAYVDEPLAELAAWVAAEMNRRLDRI